MSGNNPMRKAQIKKDRLFNKLKELNKRYTGDTNVPLSGLGSHEIIVTIENSGYNLSNFSDGITLSKLVENRENIPTLTEISGILSVKQTIHQSSAEIFKIQTHERGNVIISSDSIPENGETELVTQHYHVNDKTEQIFGGDTTFTGNIDISKNNIHVKDISAIDISCSDISATNLYVRGNLIVKGESSKSITIINSTNLDISDNMITLNSGIGDSIDNITTGIIMRRSAQDSSSAFIGWVEDGDYFALGLTDISGSNIERDGGFITEYGTLWVGDISGHDISANNLFITGDVTGNLTGDVTGNASTATKLATARTIGDVSFNGSANIDLPGVNAAGTQNTSGNAATATLASTVTVTHSAATTNFPVVFNDESNALLDDTGTFTYQPSTGTLKATKLTDGTASITSGAVSGVSIISASGNITTSGGIITGSTITDGTLSSSSGTVTGAVALTASGKVQGGSISDGTATLTGGKLTALTEINNGSALTIKGDVTIQDGENDLNIASHDGSNGLQLAGTLVKSSAAELNTLYNVTAGTVTGSKALVVDSIKNIGSLGTVTATTFSGALSGNANTATILETARTIGGVSFNGSVNINLPGVNANQTNASYSWAGNAGTATKLASATTIGGVSFDGSAAIVPQTVTIADEEDTNANRVICFADSNGNKQIKSDGDLTYNPSTGTLTATKLVGALTGGITGDLTGNISGNSTCSGNFTVGGDLTVNGSVTSVSTTNTTITDRLIELGNGTTGTPANDAGIIIERGDQNNAFIGWDESADKFTVGTTTATGSSTGDLSITKGTLVANIEGAVTGDVTGNADTATVWETARTLTLAGDVTGSVSINGSADITLTATVAANSVALGTDTTGNYVKKGATSGNGISGSVDSEGGTFTVTSNATNANTGSTIVWRDTNGNFSAGTITAGLTGNASTATTLETARTIGGVSFNGSANINLPGVNEAGNQNTTGNAATATKIVSIINSDIVQLGATQTLTNKTLTSPTFTGTLNVSGNIIIQDDISCNDICANKIYYSNKFSSFNALPSPSTYHGMFAHVHEGVGAENGKAYYSHSGGWVELADKYSLTKSFTAGDISVNNIFLPANTATTKIKITETGDIDISGNMFAQGQISTTSEANATSTSTGSIIARGGVGITGNLVVGGTLSGSNMVMGISSEGIGVGGTFGSPQYILPLFNDTSGNVLTCQDDGRCIWGPGGGGGGGGGGSSPWTIGSSPTRIYYSDLVAIGAGASGFTGGGDIKLHVAGDAAITKNITAYYSDERLKTFQGKIPNAIKKINQLNGYYFVENELAKSLGYNNDKVQVGVSAQEVEKVLPEIVTQAPIDKKYKTVWYDKLTPLLIEGIKEQQQQIENQQQQIDELKSLINK